MWITTGTGKRRRVRQQDAELLLGAIAQNNPKGVAFASIRVLSHSKMMMRDLFLEAFEKPKIIGYEQSIADAEGWGINSESKKSISGGRER